MTAKAKPQPVREPETPDDLPEGWVRSKLGDLSFLVTSGSRDWSKFYSANGAFFVRSAEINDYTLRLSEAIHVALPEKIEGKRSRIERGDLLVTITGANVGKCAKVDTEVPEAYVSQSVALVKLRDCTLAPIIYYALRAPTVGEGQLFEMAYGVGRPVLSLPQIKSIDITLPPYEEQFRIVAKIEELLEAVDVSRARLAKVPKILKAFRQSVLAAACSGRLTEDWRKENRHIVSAQELLKRIRHARNVAGRTERVCEEHPLDDADLPDIPETWSWAAIHEIAEVQGGIQKQPKRAPKKHAYPYLRVANVLRNRLDLSEIHRMELFGNELDTYRLLRGDLLIVEGNGSITEIGRSALWSGEIRDCVHQNHIIRVRAIISKPEYLNAYWNSPIGIGRVMEVAVTTAGLFSLSTKKIAAMPAPIPPLEEQREIVRRVEILFKLADKIEKRVEAATKRADKLTQSILAKAFRGELVPTDAELARQERRDYEPASVLLERIKAEREKAPAPARAKHSRVRSSPVRSR